jgi:hypothetical protein
VGVDRLLALVARWQTAGFCHRATTDLDLYVVNAKGTGLQRITTSNVDEFAPVWTAVIGKGKR